MELEEMVQEGLLFEGVRRTHRKTLEEFRPLFDAVGWTLYGGRYGGGYYGEVEISDGELAEGLDTFYRGLGM